MIEQFLIGTYTKKTSKGIYKVTLDTDQEKITNVELAIPSQKPAYLQVGQDGRIYAIKQVDDKGGVASYSLSDDNAKMLSDVLAAGAPPAYVGVDNKRHLLFSANYHTAKIDVFKINEDGTLTQTDSVLHEGATGPEPEQEAPHVHYADLTPDNRLVVCDLGMDLVVVYDVSDDGKLTAVSRYKCEDGFGTRHIAFHPNGNYAYLLGELSSKLEVLKYNSKDASFKHLQRSKQFLKTGQLTMEQLLFDFQMMVSLSILQIVVKILLLSLKYNQTLLLNISNLFQLKEIFHAILI